MIIDGRELFVMSFNFTHLDVSHSRGFGIITRKGKFVQEALRLVEADIARQPFVSKLDTFVVSPVNARKLLGEFIREAKKELVIYDPKIADREMIHALSERVKKNVAVRVIGTTGKKYRAQLGEVRVPVFRLHTRTIIRDRRVAFVGSQSLRQAELDTRREVGLIIHDRKVVNELLETFEADWELKVAPAGMKVPTREIKKRMKSAVAKLSPLNPIVKEAVKEVVAKAGPDSIDPKEVKETVENAVKEAVRERVDEILYESEDQ
jgi:phosphatidylserine/phosphatidylglycerophosphate/cardiolipin synthase-like enzyme